MEAFWNGTFAKHYLGTHDISNHLEILDYDIEHDDIGGWTAHVQVGFIGSNEVVYEYDVEVDGPDVVDQDLLDAIVEQILQQHI